MDTSKLITLGIVGVGLYLLYEWMISQCETVNSGLYGSSTCSMLLGTSNLPAVTVPLSTVSTPALTVAASTIATNTGNAANLTALLSQTAIAAGETGNLTPDQWSFYYQQIPGKPIIPAAQFENVLGSLGLSDATRGTQVTPSQFASALVSQGLSGLNTSRLYQQSFVPGFAINGGRYM
jgi:hypothetical protein